MKITKFGNGYTVFFQGDEIYFDTFAEAAAFVNEQIKEMRKEK